MAMPSLNKSLVLELVRCEWIDKSENVIVLGSVSRQDAYRIGTRIRCLSEREQRRLHDGESPAT